MIVSPHNPKIQAARDLLLHAKARREAQAFVVEGVRLVEEAQQAGWKMRQVLWSSDLSPRGRALVERCSALRLAVDEVSPAVLNAISDTQTPQGLLAIVEMKPPPALPAPDFWLILDALRDPGNLGTILRTASAAGVQAALLSSGCTDPYAPKVARAAMGAHFHLPIYSMDWPQIAAATRRAQVYLADAGGDLPYYRADLRAPLALLIGGEAEGAGREAQALPVRRLSIPMPGRAESLNAAAAASILIFEVVKQRSV